MEKHSSEDIYNVNKYTDIELFQVLDLINPSDRELEAKIIQMINKYQNIKNESGSQLYRFFNDIYNHFFENSDDEHDDDDKIVEGLGEREIVYSGPETRPNRYGINPIINNGVNGLTYGTTLGFGNTVVSGNTIFTNPVVDNGKVNLGRRLEFSNTVVSGNTVSYGTEVNSNTVIAKTIDVNTDYRKGGNVSLTKPLDYSKDTLNPLLKQTVRRIVSIDSSYRPNNKDIATEFTFNLSEPLKDVLSLKLYSVQIPYSWYTISNQYGSNYFYLKGNSDGINNGNHDYKIEIAAGNYTQVLLVEEINKSIAKVALSNPHVKFGNTSVIYVASTQLATIKVDITKLYNESNYYLYFPNWTTPTDAVLRNDSIPGFLGYNYTQYCPSIIYSNRNLSLTSTNTTTTDYTNSVFKIDSNNYFFTIKQYTNNIGYGEYTNASYVDWSYDISFNKTYIQDLQFYPRQALYNDINRQLQNDPNLINSYIERVDIRDPLLDGCGNSFYKMFIQLNPKTTPNIKNSKTIVIFPDESYNNNERIWTGTGSCFSFDTSYNELNNVISETQTLQTNYIVRSGPYIKLECINANYISSLNDYSINIQNSSATGYTLDEYISAINSAIVTRNNSTKTTINTNGVFNINGDDYVNSYTNVITDDSNDSKIRFRFDINKKFDETTYEIIFVNNNTDTNTFFSNVLNFSNDGVDLSVSNILTSNFGSRPSYTIDPLTNPYLMTIMPIQDSDYGNDNAPAFNVKPINSTVKLYASLKQMENDINSAFNQFTDNDGDYVLKGTNVIFTIIDNSTVNATLTIKVNKVLNQSDYKVIFYDPKSNTSLSNSGWSIDASNSWYNFLKIPQQSFNLNDYLVPGESYAQIYGSSPIYGNEITLIDNSNNYFYLKPMSNADGVFTQKNTNDIIINISPGKYTRSQLINAINTQLSNNSLTQGSSISIFTKNTIEYTKFRININKIYTANDYRLVFYDPYSFVKCYVGSKSVKNTTWDSTIGWVLGFRTLTEYNLLKSNEEVDPNDNTKVYYVGTSSYYSTNPNTNVVSITGDAAVCVNLYNYFLIVLDDYTQSHLNDGLVTITSTESDIQLPSYASRHVTTCDANENDKIIPFTGNSTESENVNSLTQKEIYATNEKIASRKNKIKSYSSGPFVNDIFALVPMKTSGLQNGSTYIEFGGTLQNQDRTYFGPVNIHRMSVKLMNERGDVVDLNGANWSFSLMCEQLYQQRTL